MPIHRIIIKEIGNWDQRMNVSKHYAENLRKLLVDTLKKRIIEIIRNNNFKSLQN